jgi:hypothetical protein
MDFDWGIIVKNKQVLWDGMKLSLTLFGVALAGGSSSARCSPWRGSPAGGSSPTLRPGS